MIYLTVFSAHYLLGLNISRSFKSLSILNIGSVCALYRLHAIIRIIFVCNFTTRPQSNPMLELHNKGVIEQHCNIIYVIYVVASNVLTCSHYNNIFDILLNILSM